jgi:hypothetical protein
LISVSISPTFIQEKMMMKVCLVFLFGKLHVLKFQNGTNKNPFISLNENATIYFFDSSSNMLSSIAHDFEKARICDKVFRVTLFRWFGFAFE